MADKKQAMRAAKLTQVNAANTRARQELILQRAWDKVGYWPVEQLAEWSYKDARAITKALIPGIQNNKNAGKLINTAVLALARQIRKRASK